MLRITLQSYSTIFTQSHKNTSGFHQNVTKWAPNLWNYPFASVCVGVDRLDRDLTIGQMQGKFQMQVLPQCGHAVHEDQPHKVGPNPVWTTVNSA